MEYFAGVDIGSTMTKVVIISDRMETSLIGPTGPEHRKLANRVMEEALGKARLSFDDLTYIVATGYGRINVPFADRQITEITCHAKGLQSLLPSVKTVIDVGGQDSKGIKILNGKVMNFVMNDKCAAGTGRFLEIIADSLGVPLDKIGEISLTAEKIASVSSTCTVFAEQEIISRLATGEPIANLLAGHSRCGRNEDCITGEEAERGAGYCRYRGRREEYRPRQGAGVQIRQRTPRSPGTSHNGGPGRCLDGQGHIRKICRRGAKAVTQRK